MQDVPNQRKRNKTSSPYLHDEIVFTILLFLPVDIIYNVMRFVCWQWFNIIKDPRFASAHLKQSSAGLLLSTLEKERRFFHLEKRFQIGNLEFPRGKGRLYYDVINSCDGLLLIHYIGNYSLYVVNTITKHMVRLPFPTNGRLLSSALVYVTSSNEYKVIHSFYQLEKGHFEIFTLGKDKAWRPVVPSIDFRRGPYVLCYYCTVTSIGAHVYWCKFDSVLAFNTKIEAFKEVAVHISIGGSSNYEFLAMDGRLCFMNSHDLISWDLWSLVDLECGEWRKLLNIDVHGMPSNVSYLPFFWLKPMELVAFNGISRQFFVIYNVVTGKIVHSGNDWTLYGSYSPHVCSLVWFAQD